MFFFYFSSIEFLFRRPRHAAAAVEFCRPCHVAPAARTLGSGGVLALADSPGVPYAVRAVACLVHTHPNPVVVARLFAAQNLCRGLANLIQPMVNMWRNGEAAPEVDGAAGALGDEGALLLAKPPGCYTRRCWTTRGRGRQRTRKQSWLVDLLRLTVSRRNV